MGTSHRQVMENAYGLSMSSPLAYLREYVDVMRQGLWEGRVDHQGAFIKVAASMPRPAQILLLISALGRRHFTWPAKLLMARFRGSARFRTCSIEPCPRCKLEPGREVAPFHRLSRIAEKNRLSRMFCVSYCFSRLMFMPISSSSIVHVLNWLREANCRICSFVYARLRSMS